jgi:hypothetical protein
VVLMGLGLQRSRASKLRVPSNAYEASVVGTPGACARSICVIIIIIIIIIMLPVKP